MEVELGVRRSVVVVRRSVVAEETLILRKLLWMTHGCPSQYQYGDDGEMQCQACVLDFKRDSIKVIEHRFGEMSKQKFVRALQNRKVNVKIDFKLKYDDEAKVHVASTSVLGVSSQGEDRWQAEAALADAIESLLAVALKKGLSLSFPATG